LINHPVLFVYYESIKRELKIRPIHECRCDERLQTKAKEFTCLVYTGLLGGLEHLKIETSLINEKIVNALQRIAVNVSFFLTFSISISATVGTTF
jgi:hypothetical protein